MKDIIITIIITVLIKMMSLTHNLSYLGTPIIIMMIKTVNKLEFLGENTQTVQQNGSSTHPLM